MAVSSDLLAAFSDAKDEGMLTECVWQGHTFFAALDFQRRVQGQAGDGIISYFETKISFPKSYLEDSPKTDDEISIGSVLWKVTATATHASTGLTVLDLARA